MSDRLEAWLEGRHYGQFIFEYSEPTRFEYDPDAPATPISLSLPRNGEGSTKAAGNFLENLLPDHAQTRVRMASVYHAKSTRTQDLLAEAGGDIAGGLVLLPEGSSPTAAEARLNPALDRDVADRIASIKLDQDAWVPRNGEARFSLAGTQGKFALAQVDGDWYWSNAGVPSTHIVKPGSPKNRNVESAEVAALTLAKNAGIAAPAAEVLSAGDQSAFIIDRFDRVPGSGVFARRVHAEDLAQSLGVHPDDKYGVSALQTVGLLGEVDEGGALVRGFLEQLAYNTLIGNADAHAKNYSVMLRPDGVTLAPMYDVIPVGLYPEYDQNLAMRIAGARRPQAATPEHWRKLARNIKFDEDELTDLVSRIAERVAELNPTAWDALDEDQTLKQIQIVERNVEAATRRPGTVGVSTSRSAHRSARDGRARGKTTAKSNSGSFREIAGSEQEDELPPA